MERKKFAIIIILFGLIAMIGIIYVIFFHDFNVPTDKSSVVENQTSTGLPVADQSQQVVIPTVKVELPVHSGEQNQEKLKLDDIKRFSGAFVERLGSFSSHSDYGNIVDLKIFMTKEMQVWADEYLIEQRSKKSDPNLYYGITTKAIIKEILSYDEALGEAKILVKTQRRESFGSNSNSDVFYQDITLELVKQGTAWKVGKASWKDK